MLIEVFYWLLNMSILGSGGCLIVLLLRKMKRIPRRFIFLLWLLPAVRLVIPFAIGNEYSFLNLFSASLRTIPVFGEEVSFTNSIKAADQYAPVMLRADGTQAVFQTVSVIWAVVAAGLLLTAILFYFLSRAEWKNAEWDRDNIYFSDRVAAPVLVGVFRSKILIPRETAESDLRYILLHERTHALRHDNFWRYVAVLICCIHWFNPLCWMSLKYVFTDMELACDEAVLDALGSKEKKAYAQAVLCACERRNLFAASFGGAKVKDRIRNILFYQRRSALSKAALLLLLILIFTVFATNATV